MTIARLNREVSVSALDAAAQILYLREQKDEPGKPKSWYDADPKQRKWYRARIISMYDETLAQFPQVDEPEPEAPANEG